jgi:CRP-like cAMP-binding protein
MYIKQSELFLGTSMDFVKKFMDISEMASHNSGDVLFREKDPAKWFYILLNGCVKLSVGKPEQVVYNANRNGEAFGWSSLIGRGRVCETDHVAKNQQRKIIQSFGRGPRQRNHFF